VNWEALGAIGEVAGAIGVIVTLLYLSIQIRQNSKMMKANTKQSISDASQQLIYQMSSEAEVMEKSYFNDDENLTPVEHRKAWFLCRAMLRGFESQIYQHGVGLLDDAEWANLKRVILETTRYPGFISLWPELAESVSDPLRNIIEHEGKSVTK
jgi:hypothetical protein